MWYGLAHVANFWLCVGTSDPYKLGYSLWGKSAHPRVRNIKLKLKLKHTVALDCSNLVATTDRKSYRDEKMFQRMLQEIEAKQIHCGCLFDYCNTYPL